MEITSLPTESLYKFLALAGLVILTVLPTYLYKLYMQISEKLFDTELEADIIDCRKDAFEKLLKTRYGAEFGNDGKLISNDYKANLSKDELVEINNHFTEIRIDIAKFKSSVKRARHLHNHLSKLRKLGIAAALIGATMTGIGFHRWYIIQEHSDSEVLNRVVK